MIDTNFKEAHAGIKVGDEVFFPLCSSQADPGVIATRVQAIAESGRISVKSHRRTGRVGYTDRRYYRTFEDAKAAEVAYYADVIATIRQDLAEVEAHLEEARMMTEPI